MVESHQQVETMRITYIVHGYPPSEYAGTEQHTALLVEAMKELGHTVQVISATRSVGHQHLHILEVPQENIVRIVNNIPSRPLSTGETDKNVDHIITSLVDKFAPDIIHIQHIQFLSSSLRFTQPTIYTLHDAWLWCPSGGTLLQFPEQDRCTGPTREKCPSCYTHWQPKPSNTAFALLKLAEKLHPYISPSTLHRLWKKLPQRLREPIARERHNKLSNETSDNFQRRQDTMLEFAKHMHVLISPSKFLQYQAHTLGISPVRVIPHGVHVPSTITNTHIGGQGFVYISTMQRHKGPHIVDQAYNKAFPNKEVPLKFYGDGPVTVSNPTHSAVSREKVFSLLQHADYLILGSIWSENAPMIILEARAIGCPIIAPNIGGIPEILEHNTDGFLYKVGDITDLAQTMRQAVHHLQTKKIRPTLPPHTQTMIEQYHSLYQELCDIS